MSAVGSDWSINGVARLNGGVTVKGQNLANVAYTGAAADISGLPAAQVQADWTQTDSTKPSYIANKYTKLSQFEPDLSYVNGRLGVASGLSVGGGNGGILLSGSFNPSINISSAGTSNGTEVGQCTGAGNFFTNSAVGDAIVRTVNNRLLLGTGQNTSQIVLSATGGQTQVNSTAQFNAATTYVIPPTIQKTFAWKYLWQNNCTNGNGGAFQIPVSAFAQNTSVNLPAFNNATGNVMAVTVYAASNGVYTAGINFPFSGIWTLTFGARFNSTSNENALWFAPSISAFHGETSQNSNGTRLSYISFTSYNCSTTFTGFFAKGDTVGLCAWSAIANTILPQFTNGVMVQLVQLMGT